MSIIILSYSTSCSEKSNVHEKDAGQSYCLEESFKNKIELAQPTRQFMKNIIHLTGVVEPNPENVMRFSNLVDGIIVNTHFSLGDYVNKGQVLAEVKSTELTNWRAQQRVLIEQLQVAQEEVASAKSMFDDGILSNKEYVKIRSEAATIQAELEEVNANLELYNASSKSNVFLIKAPGSGYIIEKNIYTGKQVESYSESLFTIAELNNVWVQVNVYSSDLKHIKEGMKVNIRSLSYPDTDFVGKIDAISYVLDAESRLTKARVSLKNDDLLLKPGMFVDVYAHQETTTEVLGIPLSATIFDNNTNYVIVYKNECEIELRKVDFMGQTDSVSFVSNSLAEEDRIITKNHILIYEQIKNFKN